MTLTTNDEVMRLLLKNQSMLSVFVHSMVPDWDIVDDVLQETSVYICSHWQEYQPDTNFGAWARAIARNRVREAISARQKKGLQVPDLSNCNLSQKITEPEWESFGGYFNERKQALAECIKSLPDGSRRVIQLHYDERKRVEAVAKELQRSLDAVYKLLSRIRAQLRQCVEQRVAQGRES